MAGQPLVCGCLVGSVVLASLMLGMEPLEAQALGPGPKPAQKVCPAVASEPLPNPSAEARRLPATAAPPVERMPNAWWLLTPPGSTSPNPRVPSFTPFTVAPVLQNRDAIAAEIERAYPTLLRDAGLRGRAQVWLLIDENGVVRMTEINTSSGYPDLDQTWLRIACLMRFSPAQNEDRAVSVWVSIPIQSTQ